MSKYITGLLLLSLILAGCPSPSSSQLRGFTFSGTQNPVSSHYIIFHYGDDSTGEAGKDYKFVVLPTDTTAPANYAAIGAYDGHITLKYKTELRSGLIFLPGEVALDGDADSAVRVPTATLAASTTYKLYAARVPEAGEEENVRSIDVQTGFRGPESPFRVRRNGSLLTRIYVGKKYGIVPFTQYTSRLNTPSQVTVEKPGNVMFISSIMSENTVFPRYDNVVNHHDMRGTGGVYAEGVLLFLNSTDNGVNTEAQNLGFDSVFRVAPENNSSDADESIELRFSDDADGERSITNESGFATSPAVD